MPTVELLSKALGGNGLTEMERLQLSPPLLAQLAIGGHIHLWRTDRRRMSKSLLGHLAMCGCIELARTERDSLSPQTLAILATSRNLGLSDSEVGRLPCRIRKVIKRRSIDNRMNAPAETKVTERHRNKAV